MTDPVITDLRRELEKARLALIDAQSHLSAHAEMNAALHCSSDRVMYSPLHAKVTSAIAGIEHALARTQSAVTETALMPPDAAKLIRILTDLDRCMHGRHQGDDCGSCDGPSRGNPHMRTGRVIGYGLRGDEIVMPPPETKHDPAAWRTAPADPKDTP